MHIGILMDTLGGGGAEAVTCRLTSGLIERGHKVDILVQRPIIHHHPDLNVRVLYFGGAPDRLTEELSAGVLARAIQLHSPSRTHEWARQAFEWVQVANALRWNPVRLPSSRRLHLARLLTSYMEVERPDCVLPQDRRSILATLIGRSMTAESLPIVPVIHANVQMTHEDSPYKRWHARSMFRDIFHQAAHFVGVSQGVSDSLASLFGVPREKITTIYNPVVTPDLRAKAAEQPDHPWFRDNGVPVILSAVRLEDRQKDHPTLIRAFALLSARAPVAS